MPAMFIVAVGAMGLVLVVLAVVVVGIRQEPPAQELTGQAPRLMASVTRRLLGVYVRGPGPFWRGSFPGSSPAQNARRGPAVGSWCAELRSD
jgi:hypothetical protein